MRILAAAMVIITHSLVLTGETEKSDILYKISGGEIMISTLGLRMFFVISGLLIMQSMATSATIISFVFKRVLRIFPGLIVCVLLTVFLFGPIFTDTTIRSYFDLHTTWTYLINISLYKIQLQLPSVFESNLVQVVNGSIWTLAYEFSYYMMVIGLSIIGIFKKRSLIFILFAIFLALQVWTVYYDVPPKFFYFLIYTDLQLNHFSDFGLYFTAGSIAYLYSDSIRYTHTIALIAFLAYSISIAADVAWVMKYTALPYLILYAGYMPIHPKITAWGKNGDFSYGIYIYGMIIQQAILTVAGVLNPYVLSLLSLIAVFPFAWLSWHLIEKNALKLKTR
jgi:peptidoglycan/LPS O-acetylase OafA/YrhL